MLHDFLQRPRRIAACGGKVTGRSLLFVHRPYICARADQRADNIRMTAQRSIVQRRFSLKISFVDLRSCFEQFFHKDFFLMKTCDMQGRFAAVVAGVNIGVLRKNKRQDFRPGIPDGMMQGRGSRGVRGLYIRALGKQVLQNKNVARARRFVDKAPALDFKQLGIQKIGKLGM